MADVGSLKSGMIEGSPSSSEGQQSEGTSGEEVTPFHAIRIGWGALEYRGLSNKSGYSWTRQEDANEEMIKKFHKKFKTLSEGIRVEDYSSAGEKLALKYEEDLDNEEFWTTNMFGPTFRRYWRPWEVPAKILLTGKVENDYFHLVEIATEASFGNVFHRPNDPLTVVCPEKYLLPYFPDMVMKNNRQPNYTVRTAKFFNYPAEKSDDDEPATSSKASVAIDLTAQQKD